MRLRWNPAEFSFEAEFQDFQGDLAAVKAAFFEQRFVAASLLVTTVTGDIQGIKVKAVTDPLSLKTGWTLKYNAATGELEFAP